MLALLMGDACSAARALLATRPGRRDWVLRRIFAEARRAGQWRRAGLGPHPVYGDGSVMTAALRRPTLAEPDLTDPDYCACLIMVLNAARSCAGHQPFAQERQVGMAGSS